MPITEFLTRNATYFKNDVALVEINPEIKNIPHVTWREYSLIEAARGGAFRKQLTWGEFEKQANRFANLLLTRGIKKGDKVAILLMNCLDWLPIYFGILKAGAVAVPLNFRYTAEEISQIQALCRRYDLQLFVDGARLGYGLMSPASDISLSWLARHCDAFYIGGTKVGALCGEAVVFPRGNAPKHFFSNVKRHGALLAKGRVVGVQFDALFTESLYFTISRHAIVMAEKLKRVLSEAGIPFYMDSPTNQQFVLLPAARAHELKQRVDFTLWGPAPHDASLMICRFVTSWATTEQDLEQLRRILK